jgi:hypothetical protein
MQAVPLDLTAVYQTVLLPHPAGEGQTQQELRGQVPNREMVEVEELLGLMQPLIAAAVAAVGKVQVGNLRPAEPD